LRRHDRPGRSGGDDDHAGPDHLPSGEEEPDRIDRFAANALSSLHVFAHPGDRLAQASLDTAQGDPQALSDLAVAEVAEVSELDQLLLTRGQRADRLINSLPNHGA